MYLRTPKFGQSERESDACALAGSEACLAAGLSQKLAEMSDGKASELANRPGVGLSEWAGTMQSLMANVRECGGSLDLAPLLKIADKYDLSSHLPSRNVQDYGGASDTDRARACLQFAQSGGRLRSVTQNVASPAARNILGSGAGSTGLKP